MADKQNDKVLRKYGPRAVLVFFIWLLPKAIHDWTSVFTSKPFYEVLQEHGVKTMHISLQWITWPVGFMVLAFCFWWDWKERKRITAKTPEPPPGKIIQPKATVEPPHDSRTNTIPTQELIEKVKQSAQKGPFDNQAWQELSMRSVSPLCPPHERLAIENLHHTVVYPLMGHGWSQIPATAGLIPSKTALDTRTKEAPEIFAERCETKPGIGKEYFCEIRVANLPNESMEIAAFLTSWIPAPSEQIQHKMSHTERVPQSADFPISLLNREAPFSERG